MIDLESEPETKAGKATLLTGHKGSVTQVVSS